MRSWLIAFLITTLSITACSSPATLVDVRNETVIDAMNKDISGKKVHAYLRDGNVRSGKKGYLTSDSLYYTRRGSENALSLDEIRKIKVTNRPPVTGVLGGLLMAGGAGIVLTTPRSRNSDSFGDSLGKAYASIAGLLLIVTGGMVTVIGSAAESEYYTFD